MTIATGAKMRISFALLAMVFVLNATALTIDDAKDNPMNLVYNSSDANSFAFNPAWHYQLATQQLPDARALCGLTISDPDHPEQTISFGNPPCSNQTSAAKIDYPWGWHDFVCTTLGGFGSNDGNLHGHANWFPVEYSGRVFWQAFEHWPQDGDYNLSLQTASDAGQTHGNEQDLGSRRIELEFASSEVNSRFQSPFWQHFRDSNDSVRAQMIGRTDASGNDAFAWGLMGLDSEHFAHSELHPLYAIAIHDPSSTNNDDIWHIWVRNWGDEGFCGQFSHDLDSLPTFQLKIPAPAAATGSVLNTTSIYSYPSQLPWSAAEDSDSVVIAFNLGPPTQRHMFDGDLHIRWKSQAGGGNTMKFVMPQPLSASGSHPPQPKVGAEPIERWLAKLPSAKRQQLLAARPAQAHLRGGRAQRRKTTAGGHLASDFLLAIKPEGSPVVTRRVDQEKEQRDRQRAIAICRAQAGAMEKLLPDAACTALLKTVAPAKKR